VCARLDTYVIGRHIQNGRCPTVNTSATGSVIARIHSQSIQPRYFEVLITHVSLFITKTYERQADNARFKRLSVILALPGSIDQSE
jgi:hypothetical protein